MLSSLSSSLLLRFHSIKGLHSPLTSPFPYTPPSPKSDFVLEAASAPSPEEGEGEETSHLDALAAAYDASPMHVRTPLAVDNAHQSLGGVQGLAASPWVLFKLNLWRCSLQVGCVMARPY